MDQSAWQRRQLSASLKHVSSLMLYLGGQLFQHQLVLIQNLFEGTSLDSLNYGICMPSHFHRLLLQPAPEDRVVLATIAPAGLTNKSADSWVKPRRHHMINS